MKISDFENVSIGTMVMYGSRAIKIEDIDRRNHTALLDNKWVRCSEFDIADYRSAYKKYKIKPDSDELVVCVDDDGNEMEFSSIRDCARIVGMSRTLVNYYIRTGKKAVKRGFTFYRKSND